MWQAKRAHIVEALNILFKDYPVEVQKKVLMQCRTGWLADRALSRGVGPRNKAFIL